MSRWRLVCSTVGHRYVVAKIFYDHERTRFYVKWRCPCCDAGGVTEESEVQKMKDRRSLFLVLLFVTVAFGVAGLLTI